MVRRSSSSRRGRALAAGLAASAMLAVAAPVAASAAPKSARSLVYFIYNGPVDEPYFGPMLSGAQAVEKYYPNLDIRILSANSSATAEVSQVKEAIAAGAKGIILNPIANTDTQVAVQAMKQGIPVVTLDRDIADSSGRIAFIGDKDVTLGKDMATTGISWLKSRGIKPPWHVVVLQGTLGASTAVDRLDGTMDVLKPLIAKHEVDVVLNTSGAFATGTAQSIMTEELSKTTNIQLVICGNDAMALGVVNAYAAHGLKSSLGKTVGIAGADAQPDDLRDIGKGTQLVTVTHSPYVEAFWAVEAMSNYLTSHTKPSAAKFPNGDVVIPMDVVTKANVKSVAGWGTPRVVPPLPYGTSTSHRS